MTLPAGLLLADKSAWERAGDARVRDPWREALMSGRIVTCLPVRYELLYSARDAAGFAALEADLAALRDVAVTASVQRAAMAGMRALTQLGPNHHRVPLADLLIAAAAQEHHVTVLHEDRHFEHLQRVFRFQQARILPG